MCMCERMSDDMLRDTIISLETEVHKMYGWYNTHNVLDEKLVNVKATLDLLRQELGRRSESDIRN